MTDMIEYTRELLLCIAQFLGASPIIYLFGVVVGCFVVKIMKQLMSF